MSVRGNLQSIYRDLKPIQRRIADYLMSLDLEGLDAPIDEYARQTGASVASISRFCKKIGYDSFQSLKIGLSRELEYEPDLVLPIFRPDDDPELTIRKAFSEAVANLQSTETAVDFEAMKTVAGRIAGAGQLVLLGLGGSGGVANLGEIMFTHLGFNARAIIDPYAMLVSTGHVRGGDVVVGLTHSGRTRAVLESVRQAREKGAFAVGITNYPRSPLRELVDAALITACQEPRVHVAQSNSMVAQLAILRALFVLVASRSEERVVQEVQSIEASVQRSLRVRSYRNRKNGDPSPANSITSQRGETHGTSS
ncbi:MAG: MurR/RpiR family transcriptional regulator [Spirochaetales bacterium]|nr:MurR/RpiR family transcriptional regulator [Spirochaetales bacterium]